MTFIDLSELSEVTKHSKPGDIIYIKNGNYRDIKISIYSEGTQDNRILIKSETPGQVIISGESYLTVYGSYTTIANLVFTDGGADKSIKLGGKHNRITSFDISFSLDCVCIARIDGYGCRFDHCVFRDHDKEGDYLIVNRPNNKLNYALIDHNIFKNRPEVEGVGNGMEAVRIGTSLESLSNSKSIVENNYFEKCDGEIEIISVKSCENILCNNTFKNSKGTLTLRHGDRSIVYRNKFIGDNTHWGHGGVRITGEDHLVKENLFYDIKGNERGRVPISFNCGRENTELNGYYQVKNAIVDNNVILNCGTAFAIGYGNPDFNDIKPIQSIIKNNLVSNTECVISQNPECIGSEDMKYENNSFNEQNISTNDIILSDYGCDSNIGLKWDEDPLDSELGIDVKTYYGRKKRDIIPEPIIESVPEPVIESVLEPEISETQLLLNRIEYLEIKINKIENYLKIT